MKIVAAAVRFPAATKEPVFMGLFESSVVSMQLHNEATYSTASGIGRERGVHAASMDSLNGASFLSRIA
jgi:hypothetical protein